MSDHTSILKANIRMKLLLTALLFPITVLAQGDINPPPGAPVASMKTLAQIEARTPISTVTNITVKG
ncbi:MAG: hypothetical protein EOP51_13375 [Sphingobacteriales bacterium]|nr:MAG: hypothetical protein EOP51_13375 [Sphingobacteriales bacterium]